MRGRQGGPAAAGEAIFDTRAVARYLKVNEKMVYALIADKGLPATKVTGKWLFPRHLVDQWLEAHTRNYPAAAGGPPVSAGLLVIAGSNDPLLDETLAMFNRGGHGRVAVFGNLGSLGGLRALRRGQCHIATSHLLQEDAEEYNFGHAARELARLPAVVNFCRRRQGLLVAAGNPKGIGSVADLGRPGVRIVNRPLGTGTRLLLERELRRAGIRPEALEGFGREVARHLDVGLEVLAGRADAGPAVAAVAGVLGLDFVPLRWERFDLLIAKESFFEEDTQRFLGLLREEGFERRAAELGGYDTALSGRMLFPADQRQPAGGR